jgi:pre-mRNA-splicing factor CWC22
MKEYYQGLFPMDNMSDLRFAINYYTTIGLGQLTEEMREVLTLHEEIINERKRKEEEAQAQILLREEEEMMKMILEEQAIKQEQ